MNSDGERKGLLTVGEVSDLLRISVHTLNPWRSQKRELPYVKFGERMFYDIEDIKKYIISKKIQPNEIN